MIITSRLPRFNLGPKLTTPSISLTTAGSDGLRASNNSVTRGKPPVISPDLPNARGIFTSTSPAWIVFPSSTRICDPTGRSYVLVTEPSFARTLITGF